MMKWPEISYATVLRGSVISYAQVFFSDKRWFGILLLLTSFIDRYSGLAGLIAVITANMAAEVIGLNRFNIRRGYYGFNAVLTGLGLGIIYTPSWQFYFILIAVAVLVLFITIAFEGILGKYGLPYLSIPFLLGIWTAILATRNISSLELSERGIFWLNQLYDLGGMSLVEAYLRFDSLPIPETLAIYFKSLGAIFFQNYILSGIIISIGLLFFSRIAFSLSLIGFFTAYAYYELIGANIHELSYSFIGFNYILTAIAIGGFFLIPSLSSYIWTVLLIPLLALVAISSQQIMQLTGLPILAIPFVVVVLLFLYLLKFRLRHFHHPQLVINQQFSPEKNLYSWQNYRERFGMARGMSLSLPFFGEWIVTQGYNGEHTHKQQWRFAWDFEVCDEEGKTYSGAGDIAENYHCFNKPVAAPAEGIIEIVEDGIEDNPIGVMNTFKNWGNTIIIRHAPDLFTQLSHLRKGSIRVVAGQSVRRGEVIAHCGNSGRSAVPHLHYQVQLTPSIGSATLDYPPAHYLLHTANKPVRFLEWSPPRMTQIVGNVKTEPSLQKALGFTVGQQPVFEYFRNGIKEADARWEVKIDLYGYTYIECQNTGAKAWFSLYNSLFQFTHYEGSRKSPLFLFYLSAFKIVLSFSKGLVVTDKYPVYAVSGGLLSALHDFIAPFGSLIRGGYRISYLKQTDYLSDSEILLRGKALKLEFGTLKKLAVFSLRLSSKGILEFKCRTGNQAIVLKEKI